MGSHIPPEIMDKLNQTKCLRLSTPLKFKYNHVAIIDSKLPVKEFEKIPYKFIVCGGDAIESFFGAIGFCNRLLEQCIGFFCYSIQEIVAITAAIKEIIPNNTHQFKYAYAHALTLTEEQQPFQRILNKMEQFDTPEQFASSLYPNASIWQPAAPRPQFHIVLQLWKPTNEHRWKELQACLFNNVINPLISKVHIFLDGDDAAEAYAEYPASLKAKLTVFPLTERLTYKFAMQYMSTLPSGDYAALINSDIYFNETVYYLWNTDFKNTCIGLLRYNATLDYAMKKEGAPEPAIFLQNGSARSDSQDTWIFQVNDLVEHKQKESWEELNFRMGIPGCDNTIAGELIRRRWLVSNPAGTIKTIHIQEETSRNYNVMQTISLGVYALLAPVSITDA